MRIRQVRTILLMSLPTLLLLPALAHLAMAQQMSPDSTPVPQLFMSPSAKIVTLGEVFAINVDIANVHDLTGFEFKLGYNTTLLDAIDAVEGPFLPQPLVWRRIEIHESEGYVFVLAVFEAVEGDGTLATITFEVTHTGCALCALDLFETKLYDSDGYCIDHEVHNGCYLVTSLVPEFPATIATPLLLALTLVAAFLAKIVWSRKLRSPSTA